MNAKQMILAMVWITFMVVMVFGTAAWLSAQNNEKEAKTNIVLTIQTATDTIVVTKEPRQESYSLFVNSNEPCGGITPQQVDSLVSGIKNICLFKH